MRSIMYLLLIVLSVCSESLSAADLRSVLVEKYYISDSLDYTDTIGGHLAPGSVTYRVFVSIGAGDVVKKIYGDVYHPLMISSEKSFFNNRAEGQTFAKDISSRRLNENTVALDSWITMGQTSRTSGSTLQGIPKASDTDGSFVGGPYNDGGSATVPGGMLQSQNPLAGPPVYLKDGYDTMNTVPGNWAHFGILTQSGVDSSIFGSLGKDTVFYSRSVSLQNSGTSGADSAGWVLLLQLTTASEIRFELNLEIEDSNGLVQKYVAGGDTLLSNEFLIPDLKYPPICGCTDPNYLEYSESFSCSNQDSCQNLIVFGCMDPEACNYNPLANYSLPEICCYPGFCNDLDLSEACPTLSVLAPEDWVMEAFPNPANNEISLRIDHILKEALLQVSDYTGRQIFSRPLEIFDMEYKIQLSGLGDGFYYLTLSHAGYSHSIPFVKIENRP